MSPDRHLGTVEDIDAYIRSSIIRLGDRPKSLSDLCRHLHGAYPTDVQRVGRALHSNGDIVLGTALEHCESTTAYDLQSASSELPIPHPLDFEWRFSRSGCERVTDLIHAIVGTADAKVALIGTSGYAEALAVNHTRLRARLFEKRREACTVIARHSSITVSEGDVAQTWHAFANKFDCVVADPPWYPVATELFVRAAAGLLRDGGSLLLCAPGLATRPGLLGERQTVLRVAAESNLVLDELLSRSIEYESPPFELSALSAGGLPGFDARWRLSDLLVFRRLPGPRAGDSTTPGVQLAIEDGWPEVSIGRARIRVNTNDTRAPHTGQTLETILAGNVLDSVSTRDPRRNLANIWTTTNRIYATGNPAQMLRALRLQAKGQPSMNDEFSSAAQQIVEEELYGLGLLGIQ